MGILTKRISNRGIEVDAGGWSASYYPADDCFNALVKLAHYEDLEESGRLVVLPNDITGEQLCKIVNACPSILGLKNHCDSHSCESCWEAALKGGGDSDV